MSGSPADGCGRPGRSAPRLARRRRRATRCSSPTSPTSATSPGSPARRPCCSCGPTRSPSSPTAATRSRRPASSRAAGVDADVVDRAARRRAAARLGRPSWPRASARLGPRGRARDLGRRSGATPRSGSRRPTLVPTSGLVEALRLVKDDGEVARIEAACGIADAALAVVAPMLEDGPTEAGLRPRRSTPRCAARAPTTCQLRDDRRRRPQRLPSAPHARRAAASSAATSSSSTSAPSSTATTPT